MVSLSIVLALRIVQCQKGIRDSRGFWIPCRGFRIAGTGFPFFVGETCIPDSSRELDSGVPELFSGFQIPRAKIYLIPETGLALMGD